jgi:Ca2+-binding EF-hand superfamily protein
MTKKLIFSLASLLLVTFVADSWGQGSERGGRRREGRGDFDAGEFMARLDLNKNGTLEGAELSERTKGFLQRLDIEVGDTVVIADVIKKMEEKRSGRDSSSTASSAPPSNPVPAASNPIMNAPSASASPGYVRKVPGFDAPLPQAAAAPKFGASATTSKIYSQYSDSVREQVENALRRYDKNGDGILDAEEIKAGRWGSPTSEESDTNRDGSLSRDELANRYFQREQAAIVATSPVVPANTGRASGGGREPDRQAPAAQNQTANAGSPTAPVAAVSNAGRSGTGTSYRDYASGLVQKYDENKDGQLDKDEMKKMRRAPPNSDRNNDGLVTLSELSEAFEEQDKNPKSTSTAAPASGEKAGSEKAGTEKASGNSRTDRNSSGSSSRERSPSTENFSVGAFDKNNDGQVQMWEFAEDWTEENLEKFRKLDKNNDGIISAAEAKK